MRGNGSSGLCRSGNAIDRVGFGSLLDRKRSHRRDCPRHRMAAWSASPAERSRRTGNAVNLGSLSIFVDHRAVAGGVDVLIARNQLAFDEATNTVPYSDCLLVNV